MGKNVIDNDKRIILQDQLYNEILNGFENNDVPESKKDKKTERLKYKQNLRIQRVGKEFFVSEFNKKWIGQNYGYIISSSRSFIKSLQYKVFGLIKNDDQDEELGEELEKTKKDDFSLFKILNFISDARRIIRTIKGVKNTVDNYKDFKASLQDRTHQNKVAGQDVVGDLQKKITSLIDASLEPTIKSVLKFYESDNIDKMWEGVKNILLGGVGEAVAWAIVGAIATNLTAGAGGLIVGGARAAQIAMRVQNLIKKIKKLKKISTLIYKGTKVAMVIEDVIHWDKEDEKQWEKWIADNITPKLEPARIRAREKMAGANPTPKIIEQTDEIRDSMVDATTNENQDSLSEEFEIKIPNVVENSSYITISSIPNVSQNDENFSINFKYEIENLDKVLETVYGVRLTDNAKKIIKEHPNLKSFKFFTSVLENIFQSVLTQQIKIVQVLNDYKIEIPDNLTKVIENYEILSQRVLSKLSNGVGSDFQPDLDKISKANSNGSITYLVENYYKPKHENNNGQKWRLNVTSEEAFRALYPTKYGFIGGVALSLKGDSTLGVFANNRDVNRTFWFHKQQNDYDVVYYHDEGKVGYKGFIVENYKKRVWEEETYDKRVDGYTTFMIDLFYYNIRKRQEMELEQSINEIVQKFYNLLIERI